MPHILVEYSSNLEPHVSARQLVHDLHHAVIQSGIAEPRMVRTRALPRDIYLVASGAPENVFVHISARIRAGRSVEARRGLGERLLRTARDALAGLPPSTPIALSVEVDEIDPEMLFRHVTVE
jgi:5-carboxymethyl-2-hydroxymuconate isomerase